MIAVVCLFKPHWGWTMIWYQFSLESFIKCKTHITNVSNANIQYVTALSVNSQEIMKVHPCIHAPHCFSKCVQEQLFLDALWHYKGFLLTNTQSGVQIFHTLRLPHRCIVLIFFQMYGRNNKASVSAARVAPGDCCKPGANNAVFFHILHCESLDWKV